MANQLNWALGQEGKGNVYDDGSISTWRTDDTRSPHHYEVGQQDEKVPRFHFYLSPEGGLWDGGTTFNNQTPLSDDDMVKKVVEQHPAVWDGRNDIGMDWDEGGDWDEPEERIQMPGGGYGHAEDLMRMGHRLASAGWADFHTEYKIPRPVRKQLRRWVDRLKWPENHTKHDAREYHITVLDLDTYDEDFAKWAKKETQGKKLHFKSTGMEMFNDFIVVRLDCPEWEDLAQRWTEEAERRGLDPHTFPGGPKAHVSVGRSHDKKWPKGVPNPHIKFNTQMFNIKRNSAWHEAAPYYDGWPEPEIEPEGAKLPNVDLYHHAPTSERARIMQHGLQVTLPEHNDHWRPGEVTEQPQGVYMTTAPHPDLWGTRSMDTWRIPKDQIQPGGFTRDPILSDAYIHDADIPNPELLAPAENYFDFKKWNEEYHPDEWGYAGNDQWHEQPPPEYQAAPTLSSVNAPDDDLKLWLDSFAPQEEQTALSPYHVNETQFKPYTKAPVVQTPHIDPPKQPYAPYNWAEEGWEESPLDRTANTHHCPQCNAMIDGQICGNCGYDPFHADSDYDKAKNEWYDRAWSHPGDQPLEVPNQPMHWRDDHAKDVSLASRKSTGWNF